MTGKLQKHFSIGRLFRDIYIYIDFAEKALSLCLSYRMLCDGNMAHIQFTSTGLESEPILETGEATPPLVPALFCIHMIEEMDKDMTEVKLLVGIDLQDVLNVVQTNTLLVLPSGA